MHVSTILFAGLAAAQTPYGTPSRGGYALCSSSIVSVSASTTQNLAFNFAVPQNQTGLTETFLEYNTAGSPFLQQAITGTQPAGGTFDIGGTLCTPPDDPAPSKVQLLTHGIGNDRYYWDFAPGYSYADVAAQHGYATFFYDRLGVGVSAKPDGLNLVQSPLETEILNQLASMLRAGAIGGVAFDTVVGGGHSFGSVLTQAVTNLYPSALDAAVITGFSVNTTGFPVFVQGINLNIANLNDARFSSLPDEYIIFDTIISNQIGYFRAPGFDPAILAQAEAEKQTATYGEFFSITALLGPAQNYTGPVLVLNGANDLPFCYGDCSYPTDESAEVKALYPAVDPGRFATYLGAVSGHSLNLHYSGADAFEFAQNFLTNNGL